MRMIDDARRVGDADVFALMPQIVDMRNAGIKLIEVIIQEPENNKTTNHDVDEFIEKLKQLRVKHGHTKKPKVKWLLYGLHKQYLSRMIDQLPFYLTRAQMNFITWLLFH